jgi:hypothetical protein
MITATIPFDDKSHLLSSRGRKVFSQAAHKLRDKKWVIEVRGHVSPFESMRYKQGTEGNAEVNAAQEPSHE